MLWLASDEAKPKRSEAAKAVLKRKSEEKRKVHAKQKREYYENDTKTRKKAVKKACHDYIRARDINDGCICCGKPLGDNFHAGHYLESGNNPLVRYDENNIHGQRLDCNFFHGGDSGEYKQRLITKIGLFEYYCLMSKKGGTDTRKPQDYKEIEVYFKNKLKTLTV